MKRLLKILLIGVASLLVLAVLAVLVLTSSPGEDFVRGWLESRLTAQIGLPVSVGKFETNLWTRVHIDALTVASSRPGDEAPVLYVGHLRVGYSIPQLIGETLALKSVSIDSIALGVRRDSLGHYGIPLLDAPAKAADETSGQTTAIAIDTISLSSIGLFYLDPQLPLTIRLDGAKLSAQGTGAGAFSGRLSAGNIQAVYDSLALNFKHVQLAASLDKETIRLVNATADCEGLHLQASGDIGIGDSTKSSVRVSVDGPLDKIAPAVAAAFDLPALTAGNLRAACQVEGSLGDPDMVLEAEVGDLVMEDVTVRTALMRARYRDEYLSIDTFNIATFDGYLGGKAGMAVDSSRTFALSAALDRIDISSLWRSVYAEDSPYRGTVSGTISAGGQGTDVSTWAGEAAVTGAKLRYLERSVPDLKCTARLASGRTDFTLSHGADTVHADVRFAADSLRGAFNVSVPDLTALARFADQPELSGGLWADGTIGGTFANPAFRAAIKGSSISYHFFPVDSLRAELSFEDSSLTVIDFACEGKLDSISAQQPPFGIDSIAGSGLYSCRFNGSLDRLTGDFAAHLDKPQYGAYAVDSISAAATISGSQITITRLEAYRDQLSALLSATYDTSTTSGSFDLRLNSRRLPSDSGAESHPDSVVPGEDDLGSMAGDFKIGSDNHLSAKVRGHALRLDLFSMLTADTILAAGVVDFDLAVDGPYLTPDGTLAAIARAVKVADYGIDSVTTHLTLARRELTLDSLTSYAMGHQLRAQGRIALEVSPDGMYEIDDSAAISAVLSTTSFDLTILKGLMSSGGEISGVASASLTVSGTLAAPRLDGWLTAERGRILLEEGSLPLENVGLALLFADSVFTIDSATGTASEMPLRATGSLTTSNFESASVDLAVSVGELGRLKVDGTLADTSVHLQVVSDSLNLAVFQPFVTQIDSLAGRLSCSMLIKGPPAAPQIDGSLRIADLSLRAPRHYMSVSGGRAEVRFDRNRVIFDSARCLLNGGTVSASGAMAHDQGELADIELSLQAVKVTLQQPGSYLAAIDSAAFTYGKQQENYVLDGDVALGETRFTAGLRPTSILPWVRSVETVEMELPDIIARTRLDVRIRESSNIWVDNNLARIRLRAALGVIGTPLRPNFTGPVEVEEGYLLYLDRRFNVNRGSVYFNDPARFNPDINLDASTEVTVYRRTTPEKYKVFIKAEGLLDQLQYGLYSEPPLEKPDIVALLTLGATRSELASNGEGNDQGGLTNVLKDRAAMLTSQRVSGYLSRRAGSLFGFDEFTIQGNLFNFDDNWGPQLVASKRLSRKLDFTYSTTVGHLNDQAVRLGYRLTRRFSLQGETDRQGSAGFDLKYGFTFK